MKPLVIYHRADYDGLFCRDICMKRFGGDADYLGWDYGDPVPVVSRDRQLIMADISIAELMDHPRLEWIDHHKSAIDKYPQSIDGYRIDGVAACRLCWQYFFTHTAVLPVKADFVDRRVVEPYAVQLAGEYDVADRRNPDAITFQYALRARGYLSEDIWRELLRIDVDESLTQYSRIMVQELLPGGRSAQTVAEAEDASLAEDASFDLEWEGLRFIAVNKPRGNSRSFAKSARADHDALLTFYWLRDRWRVSLYHVARRADLDLSQIAIKYGGGGHPGACGFEAKELPFKLG